MRMLQTSNGLRFTLEPLLVVLVQGGIQDFNGSLRVETQMLAEVDFGKAASRLICELNT